MSVNDNRLINISVNPNVLDSCELVQEVKVNKVRMEVLDNIDKVREVSKGFNPEVRGSLRPKGHKDLELREWEKNILVHLNNVNCVKRDDRKTLTLETVGRQLVRLNHRFHRLTARPDNIQLLQGRGDYPPPPTVDLEGEVEMQVRRRERGGAPDQ